MINKNNKQETEKYLIELVGKITEIPVVKIQGKSKFSELGIDSVTIMDLNRELEKQYQNLPKTLFFEYETIDELSSYLLKNSTSYSMNENQPSDSEALDTRQLKSEMENQGDFSLNQPIQISSIEKKEAPLEKFLKRKIEKDSVSDDSEIPQPNIGKEKFSKYSNQDVAIIGMSGIFPDASTIDEFWENLVNGKDSVKEIPKERFDIDDYYHPEKGSMGKSYSRWGSFIDDVDKFDPLFFGISPLEAQMLDPQERLFLQNVWHTVEDAGYSRVALEKQNVGVYVGVMWGQYQIYGANPLDDGRVLVPASSYASIANRVSYFFNFRGPSIALDTMCSSSLTAIHLACNSIRSGETSMAIAGGVNLTLHPNKHVFLSQTKFASSDGKCRSFGKGGDGYVPGEAVGSVLLKSVNQAIADEDTIYAVIRGTSINHGGYSNGYTIPSVGQQAKVIESVYKQTGIDPDTVSYIEAHGTGTELGDPIEISSLSKVFGKNSNRKKCLIGSVKSNIGHCESAAGIVGLIKTVLQMREKMIAPSLHSEVKNPNIDFDNSVFSVPQEPTLWQTETAVNQLTNQVEECPKRSAINSFGAGGANAHILLEEYIETNTSIEELSSERLYLFSAKDEKQLIENLRSFYNFINTKQVGYKSVDITAVANIICEQTGIELDKLDQELPLFDYLTEPEAVERVLYSISSVDSNFHREFSNFLFQNPKISKMFSFIQHHNGTSNTGKTAIELSPRNISYTLQTGREHLNKRIAIQAVDLNQLLEKISEVLSEKANNTSGVYLGEVRKNDAFQELLAGDEGAGFLNNLIKNQALEKLAILWTKGVTVNWDLLYSRKAKRIPIPGYEFKKDSCWLPEELLKNQRIKTSRLFFKPVWEKIEPIHSLKGKTAILIENEQSSPLAAKLGTVFGQSEEIRLCYSAFSDSMDFTELKEIDNMAIFIQGEKQDVDSDKSIPHENILSKVYKILQCIKNNEEQLKNKIVKIVLGSSNSSVEENAYNFSAEALIKSVKKEIKNVQLSVIIAKESLFTSANLENLIYLQSAEINGAILYENSEFKKLCFAQSTLDKTEDGSTLKQNGSYIIIGGSGNVGKKLSRYLAQNYRANLILIGRRKYDTELKGLSEQISNAGGKFTYYSADSSSMKDMDQVFSKIGVELSNVNGIFNLATSVSYGSFFKKTLVEFEEDLNSKVQGNLVLADMINKYTTYLNLDFYTVFSSGEAFSSSLGWGTYAAGCAFEDCYAAHFREQLGIKTLVLNWGFWDKENDPYIERLKSNGVRPFTEIVGMKCLELALNSKNDQLLILDVDAPVLEKMGIHLKDSGNVVQSSGIKKIIEDNEISESIGQQDETTFDSAVINKFVTGIIGSVLKLSPDRIEADMDLTEYGVDSLIVTDIHKAFEEKLGKISITFLTENATINELAEFLKNNKKSELCGIIGLKPEKTDHTVNTEKTESKVEDLAKMHREIKVIATLDSKNSFNYLANYGEKYRNKELAVEFETSSLDKKKFNHILIPTRFGNELEVFIVGEGKPLLLLPAIGLSAPAWVNQIVEFSKTRRVLVIHNPGYGMSTVSKQFDPASLTASFVDIFNLLGIEKTDIIASCFGGVAAQNFAADYSNRVDKLILVGAFYKNFGLPNISIDEIPIDKMSDATQMVGGGITSDFDTLINSYPERKSELVEAKKLLTNSQCVSPIIVMRYIMQILQTDTRQALARIEAPTLCIAGELDTIVATEASRFISDAVENGEYFELKDAAHYPYLTNKKTFNEVVHKFLSGEY
jgi:3-oxoacyl-(acyl-carrier-protein) synthase/pimeloyl-ACP methyl ester carboxylesterase/acyl carrier protein